MLAGEQKCARPSTGKQALLVCSQRNVVASCRLPPGASKNERQNQMTMTGTRTTERRETASLIGSDKVDGTAVYGSDQKRIGSIQRIMIDKISGKVAYAVMSFGGFLGIGEDYYPVPWPTLKYDTS